jgi:hypothetical protein
MRGDLVVGEGIIGGGLAYTSYSLRHEIGNFVHMGKPAVTLA